MGRQPPLLPAEALRRTLRVARFDGVGILVLSGAIALWRAMMHDLPGATFGFALAAAGAVELHGVGLIHRREKGGMNWLVWSQLLVLALVLGSAAYWLTHPDLAGFRELLISNYTPEQQAILKQIPAQLGMNMTTRQALHTLFNFMWIVIGLLTLIYQGGMLIYYRSRRKAVAAALQE